MGQIVITTLVIARTRCLPDGEPERYVEVLVLRTVYADEGTAEEALEQAREYTAADLGRRLRDALDDTVAGKVAEEVFRRDLPASTLDQLADLPDKIEQVVAEALGDTFGAEVAAAFLLEPAEIPATDALTVLEVAGLIMATITGAHPLVAVCGKHLLKTGFTKAVAELVKALTEGLEPPEATSSIETANPPKSPPAMDRFGATAREGSAIEDESLKLRRAMALSNRTLAGELDLSGATDEHRPADPAANAV
jgi:hypothetical protein